MSHITLAICNYNRERTIERAVRSCLSQIINNRSIQVLVVDDCSTDQSLSLLEAMPDNFEIIRGLENSGIGAVSNIAIQNAQGEYWMRVDSDDYLSMHAASIFSLILDENPEVGFVYGDIVKLDQNGYMEKKISLAKEQTYMDFGAGVMFRRSVLQKVGGYDSSLRNAEDYDLFSRLKINNVVGMHIPLPLYRYYAGDDNLTNGPARDEIKMQIDRKYKYV